MIKLLIPAALLLAACQFNQPEADVAENATDSMPAIPELTNEDKAAIRDLIASMTPPVELTYVISDLNLQFSSVVLHPPDRIKHYANNLEQAAALGIYSSDMLYCLAYGRNDLAENYASAIKELSQKLELSDVLDIEKMRQLLSSGGDANKASMQLTAEIEKVHSHMERNGQLHLSALISLGNWIESMYIGSVVAREIKTYNTEMVEILYFESLVSQDFVEIFNKFHGLPGYEQTFADLNELKAAYSEFQVEIEKIAPKVSQGEDMTQVIDVSRQKLIYSAENLDKLVSQIGKIRNDIIR